MAKKAPKSKRAKKAQKPKAVARPKGKVVHRVVVHGKGGNRSTAAAVLPDPEPVDLGPLAIPEGPEATAVLRRLALVNDRAFAAQKAYSEAAKVASQRKKKLEELSEEVQRLLRQSTHEGDKPLLNMMTREADQKAMEESATGPGTTDPVH